MAVVKFELLHREPYLEGHSFGDTGMYERIDGLLHYAVDPAHPRNRDIVDLGLAARDADGRVHSSGDVCLLVPTDPARANRRLLVELPNRGRKRLTRYLLRAANEPTPTSSIPAGDGFLMRHGYTLAWIGWQWDVRRSDALMGLDAPLAAGVHGQTMVRFQPAARHCTHLLADLNHLPYPVVDLDDPDAALTVSDYRNGPRTVIPREQWRFASDLSGEVAPDTRYVYLPAGFEPGKVYDLVYTTAHAPVVGSGLLAVRDGAAFLRSASNDNPLAGRIDWAIGFGVSQTARMLRHFLALGLNLDEAGQQVFDGVLPNVGGGRQGEFNHRFAQPSVQPTPSPGYATPADDGGLLERQRAVGGVPKVMQTNSSAEYWRGDAALLHTSLDGTHDLPPDPESRIYHFAGTQHDPGEQHPSQLPLDGSAGRYRFNWVDYTPLLRAALVNLDRWVSAGIEPPPNVHPRLGDGTLVRREKVLAQLARLALPGLVLPDEARLQRLWQIDLGPDADRGIVRFPVEITGAFPALVPALDGDGNEVAGLRLPDLTQPLGAHIGWNPRHPDTGAPEQVLDYKGATLLFPRTAAECTATGDPRPAIGERYSGRDAYFSRVLTDARLLARHGHLLEEDIVAVLADAATRFDSLHGETAPE